MFSDKRDTICAPSTPPVESAIGIVRISGDSALKIALSVFKTKSEITPERVIRGTIELNGIKDKAIMVFFKSPRSYTGEDMVEIYIHGNPILMKKLVNALIHNGARPAEPGEFTKRAFMNGKIDLTQAESILRIVGAKSETALKIATRVLEGELKKEVENLRSLLIDSMVLIESAIEFPDDITFEKEKVYKTLEELMTTMNKMIENYERTKKVFEGYRVVIIGKPNVGKSTLFNRLLGYERAIVTPHPGTTRDYLESIIFIDGSEVKLYDTAGLRKAEEEVERKGIALSEQLASNSDLIILVVDGSNPPTEEDIDLIEKYRSAKTIMVMNKVDAGIDEGWNEVKEEFLKISALKGDGIEELQNIIREKIGSDYGDTVLIEERHKYLLQNSVKEIEDGINELKNEKLDLVAERLRNAERFLKEITGEITQEEVLNEIFSRFCIGK